MNAYLEGKWCALRKAGADILPLFWAASLIFALLVVLGPLAQGLGETVSYL
jgi:hypothetical protein